MDKEKWIALIKTKGKKNWLVIVGLLGIVLIGVSGFIGTKQEEPTVSATAFEDTQQYARSLEEQLEGVISTIQGAGKCNVLVTMEQGTEYVYATEEKNSIDVSETSEDSKFSTGSKTADEETYIMVATDNGDQPLLLTQLAPKVKGVVVVCEGGGNATVCQTIVKALATSLDISENRICVVQGTIS